MHALRTSALALLAPLLLGSPALAEDKLVVVTTLNYLADVARRVGGDQVTVAALAPTGQDPHFIQPTPARSLKLRTAEVLIESGIRLELWSERVIDGARNQAIRPGSAGHVYAASGIRPLEVPTQQSRASGDVHAGGNPHVWLDPLNLKRIAANIERCLSKVRPAAAETFKKNRKAFAKKVDLAFYGKQLIRMLGRARLNKLQRRGKLIPFLRGRKYKKKPLTEYAGGWLKRALALGQLKLISYHKVWAYFEAAFGLKVTGTIEEKPGIPASPGHLDTLKKTAAATKTKIVVAAPFYPLSRAKGVAELIGGTAAQLPTQPGETGTKDLFHMFDTIFERLEAAKQKTAQKP